MFTALAIFYVFVCAFLILVVLLQAGKSGGMGAAFGGTTQTVFGGAGAGNFLTRLTAMCAALFMVLSATLSYMSSGRGQSALEEAAKATEAANKPAQNAKAKPEPTKAGAPGAKTTPAPAPMSDPAAQDFQLAPKPTKAPAPQ
jgi:preprotein translocase subunit SecG